MLREDQVDIFFHAANECKNKVLLSQAALPKQSLSIPY